MYLNCIAALTGALRRWRDDVGGAVLIYVSLLLPILIGGAVYAIDGGRLHNLHTTMQKAADSLAMAGAAELDLKPSSEGRARNAIANMVSNKSKYAAGGAATITVSNIRFLKSLPASDADPITAAHVALPTDWPEMRFVEVTVTPQTFNTILPAAYFSGWTTKNVGATAVAGFQAAVCKTVPMFICNPYEGQSETIFDAIASSSYRRRQMKLQLGNGGSESQYFPGNYGWLDTPLLGNGATALRDALAKKTPTTCFFQNGVSQKTGNIENANDAINTRFDLWAGPFNNKKNNPEYPPAMNVRKGYKPGNGENGACNPDQVVPNQAKLGRDTAFPYAGGRMGNGNWDFETYWNTNYPGIAAPAPSGGQWSNTNLPSRHEVYQHELSTIGAGQDLVAHTSGAPYNEAGGPMCYGGGGVSAVPDRRVIHVAVINCSALNVHGNTGGPLPVLAFGKFFLTDPISKPPAPDAGTIFAELIGLAEPGSNGNEVSHDIVQLYR